MAQSRAHIQATTRYESKAYNKITLRVRKDGEINLETITAAATANGESLNQFIITAITERMERLK
jgi:uncharacterized protein (DUF1778 family)